MSSASLALTGHPEVNSIKQGSRLVMLMGPNGVVEPGPTGLTYDVATDTLEIGSLSEHTWAGPANADGQELRDADIVGGSITGATSIETTGDLIVEGSLHLEGDAQIQGHMVVSGTVMGSGPYVDSSDMRFKTAVRPIFDYRNSTSNLTGGSLDVINGLRPVRYQFKCDEFPDRHFHEGEDMGFIAQELEEVLPEVVITGEDGYKYVAYSKLTPVLTSGIQELVAEVRRLNADNEKLRNRVEDLESKLYEQKKETLEDKKQFSERLRRIEEALKF